MQTGTGHPARRRPSIPLCGKAGVVVQALLLEPERYWGVHALAARAGVSAGLAHRVLLRLDDLEITNRCGGRRSRSRILVDPAALFELWAEENVDRDYQRLEACLPIRRRGASAGGVAERIAGALDDAGVEYARTSIGLMSRAAFWIDEDWPLPIASVRAGAYPTADSLVLRSNVVFMSAKDNLPFAFAEERNGCRCANAFRVFLDMRSRPAFVCAESWL